MPPVTLRVPISHTYCRVVTDAATYEGVSFHLTNDGNTATVRKRVDVLEQRGPVEQIDAASSGDQIFTFGDGTQWVVTALKKPCGCGGG